MQRVIIVIFCIGFLSGNLSGDEPSSRPGRRLLERFDSDKDGRLSQEERQQLREALGRRGGSSRKSAPTPKIELHARDVYRLTDGPHAIGTVDFILTDAKRDHDLPVRVTFPKSDGHERFPTIVFSHGAGGSRHAYLPLVSHWVSHGYVCIQPTHGDSVSLLTAEERRSFRSLRDYVGRGLAEHQLTRPDDIRLILDSLDVIEDQIPEEHPRIQRDHIGIGGHSFGAHTTAMIAGMSLRMPASRPRITMRMTDRVPF